MTKARRSNNSREDILDAAQRVAVEKGAAKVSLDSVAREAGLTKGGVLYNFPSKEALITGMLERLMDSYRPIVDSHQELFAGQPNPTLQSTVKVIREHNKADRNISMAIMAAAAQNLALLQPIREEITLRFNQLCSETDNPDMAALLWAASEGLMLMDMMKMLPFDEARKESLLDCLAERAKEPFASSAC